MQLRKCEGGGGLPPDADPAPGRAERSPAALESPSRATAPAGQAPTGFAAYSAACRPAAAPRRRGAAPAFG